jgi:glycosyltransferase involved in cell wall biosynthesis
LGSRGGEVARMKVLVVTSCVPFVRGSAEILADNLTDALRAAGHAAELFAIPFRHCPPDRIPSQILACRLLDLTESCGARIDRILGLKFPAYLVPHPNKAIWLLHQHRTAYELWNHPTAGDLIHSPDGPVVRESIRQADRQLIPEAKSVYTLSKNVSTRLRRFTGIASEPLYHPPANALLFRKRSAADYFFFPNPSDAVNRQWLAIQAVGLCREHVRIRLTGDAGSLLPQAKSVNKLKLSDRVEWLGALSADQERDLYANCLAVIVPPQDDDYSYVALEAMLSSKPVITASDSGSPLEFVLDRQTGLIAQPAPQSLADAMDALWADRRSADAMGEAGRARYADLHINWPHVVEKLLC